MQQFAIPLSLPIAWLVTVGEIYVAIALLLGVTTRLAAGLSFFILLNFAIGGYYDASLIPFFLLSLLFMAFSSGHWLGLDRRLHRQYPHSRWFY
ncbi:DoxX family membrane protein [Oceanicoccus sagamiensis]|uniref:DoxX family membrane protein n=1 Tax=Oceanicoccus sagamiensis TaxID=716816 RepID=UPI00146D0960|nr:DoxX family membrane protein [Oceanicoccus sagamiensis]